MEKSIRVGLFFIALCWLTAVIVWKGPLGSDDNLQLPDVVQHLGHTHDCSKTVNERFKAFMDAAWTGSKPFDVLAKTYDDEEFNVRRAREGDADFFWAPQDKQQIEIMQHQATLIELAIRALDPALCPANIKDEYGMECITVWKELADFEDRELLVVDVSATHGYFGLIGAGYGYRTIFTEPQPHCNVYLQTAINLSGFTGRTAVYQVMVGNDETLTATVEERNGCLQSWPYVSDDEKKLAVNVYGGGFGFASVNTKKLDTLVNHQTSHIALLHIHSDTNAFDVLESASELLTHKAIKVILLHMSKYGWLRAEGKKDHEIPKRSVKRMTEILQFALSKGYKFKCHVSRDRLRGRTMTSTEIENLLAELYEPNRWTTTHCMLYA